MDALLEVLVYVVLLLALLPVLVLIIITIAIVRTERRFAHIPGPKRESFFLGNFKQFVEIKKKLGPGSHVVLFKWAKDYGRVFWIRMLWTPHVFSCSPELVKELLLNSRHKKPKSVYGLFQVLFGRRFMGYGLVSEIDHTKWYHKRSLVNPAFRRKYLIGMMDHFNEYAEALCQQILQRADGKTEVIMADEFCKVTLDIIAKTAFSMNLDVTRSKESVFSNTATTVFLGLQKAFDEPFSSQLNPWKEKRKFRQEVRDAITVMREAGRACITERIGARQREEHVPSDILNTILDGSHDLTKDKDYGMENILDEFVTLFVAGQDTTSNLLATIFHQLGRNPGVAKKLQAEIDEVIGHKPTVDYEDLTKLEYTMRVIKETLRLYSPAGGTSRISDYSIECCGLTIPAGTNISLTSNVMGRLEELYDDPLLFNPDRFKNPEDGALPRNLYAYFPFSIGQRSCIGQQFALMEARVIIAKLLQRFEFHLNQCQRAVFTDEVTVKHIDKCRNYVTLRT